MCPRDLLVLQRDAPELLEGQVGPDPELTDSIPLLVRPRVEHELTRQRLVRAACRPRPAPGYLDRHRVTRQLRIASAEPITDAGIANVDSFDILWCGVELSRWQILTHALLYQAIAANPAVFGSEGHLEIRAGRARDLHHAFRGQPFEQAILEFGHLSKVDPHGGDHHLVVRAGHVGVPQSMLGCKLHDRASRSQLARYRLHDHQAHRSTFESLDRWSREQSQRARTVSLEQKARGLRSDRAKLHQNRRGDLARFLVGNQDDSLTLSDGKTDPNGVTRSEQQLGSHRFDIDVC